MRKLFIVVVLLFATVSGYSQKCEEIPYVEVSGSAKTKILPNKAQIKITLREADNKGKYTMRELESNLAKALKSVGVDAKKQLSLYRQSISTEKRNKIYQFKTYMLEVYTAAEAQNVMAALAAEGISNSEIINVWNDRHKNISDSLKVAAVQSTMVDAKILSEGLGQSIGNAIRISYYPPYDNVYGGRNTFAEAGLNAVVDNLPEVNFEEIEIEENVKVYYELKGKTE